MIAAVGLLCGSSFANDSTGTASADLAAEARDPTASLLALQLRYDLVADFHEIEGDTMGTFILQPVLPFKTGPVRHVTRLTVPLITHTPNLSSVAEDIFPGLPSSEIRAEGAAGLGDIVLLDVLIFDAPGGRLGAGLVTSLPTATDADLGSQKWTLGPAAVWMGKSGPVQYGGLVQGFFSIAGAADRDAINRIALQPFLSYALPHDWSIGVSEMSFVYDIELSRWTNLPVGLNVDKLIHIGALPVRIAVQAEYNIQNDAIAAAWTTRLIVTPLFPL